MDIKQVISDSAKSAKFEGVQFRVEATKDSRTSVEVILRASVDLPGEADTLVATLFGSIGLGNSSKPVESLPS